VILDFYDTYRIGLKISKKESIGRILDNYSDFYDWIYEKGEYKLKEEKR